jgi:hypothetical protein
MRKVTYCFTLELGELEEVVGLRIAILRHSVARKRNQAGDEKPDNHSDRSLPHPATSIGDDRNLGRLDDLDYGKILHLLDACSLVRRNKRRVDLIPHSDLTLESVVLE